MLKKTLPILAITPLLWGCDGALDPEGPGQVAVRFQSVQHAGGSASASVADGWRPSMTHVPGAEPLTITGENGTLILEDISFIVAEIELERADLDCALVEEDDDDCPEFEGGPYLVRLLDGTPADVVNSFIPAGSYVEFEFEVENLEDDEDDSAAQRQAKEAILTAIREDYPAFPSRASMVAHGSFEGTPFTVYFDAEIEIEREFDAPFRVPEHGNIAVNVDPEAWFRIGSQVLDLSAYDGQTLEFEMEIEDGFASLEWDD